MIGMTVCSGIGAPEVSAPWIDWKYQSEIERFPSAVLAHRFPHARNLGDMTKFQEWPDATVDVLAGGTPCQSFSVAGLRKGLADPRGNLMLTYLAIAARYRPRWLVWENVPGVLSSNGGRDFGAFLGGMGQLGYGFAYRVLDAQYVRTPGFPRAVPQRRRRVFVVGYFGDWRPAAAVLFDAESLQGNPPPRREAGKGVAPTISARPTGGGGLGTDFDCDGGLIAAPVAACLNAAFGAKQGLENQHVNQGCPLYVAHALRGEGFDASKDGTGRGTSLVPVAIQKRAVSTNPDSGPQGAGWRDDGAAYTLEARNKVQAVAFAHQASGKQTTLGFAADGTCQTLGAHQTPAVAFTVSNARTPWAVRRLTPRECERLQGLEEDWTLIPRWPGRASAQDIEATARWIWTDDNRINGMTWDTALALARHPDGPRYKALGNSWAVNCGEYVFDGIRRVETMMKESIE